MFTITQKHPQYSESIQHESQATYEDAQKLIVRTAGLNGVDMDNIDSYKTVINSHLHIYHLSGSDYCVSLPIEPIGNKYDPQYITGGKAIINWPKDTSSPQSIFEEGKVYTKQITIPYVARWQDSVLQE